jgi:hypothetical protein
LAGRARAGCGCLRIAGALQLDADGEVVNAALLARAQSEVLGNDLDQLGLGDPRTGARQVAQQLGHALVGLRHALEQDVLVSCLILLRYRPSGNCRTASLSKCTGMLRSACRFSTASWRAFRAAISLAARQLP